uniref:Uncharacterized protein n=1 Tax=Oryza meridionalis TaxID=40149 RepID=A0A0E0CIY1_9ORYZ
MWALGVGARAESRRSGGGGAAGGAAWDRATTTTRRNRRRGEGGGGMREGRRDGVGDCGGMRRSAGLGIGLSVGSGDRTVKRIERFDEFEEMVQREIVEDVEKVERTKTEDRDSINRLLTSCGMPKGEFRDKLMWGCNVAAIFVASGAVGSLIAKIKIDGSV